MLNSRVIVDRDFVLADLDRRVFGIFAEHLGRCVYGGMYEPGHKTADRQGFRGDVLQLTKELGPTIVRYPGGNFLSGYNWEDGVGPKDQRPTRLELAWFSTETNQFGTNEFIDWCRLVGTEPMLGVNLGTRGPDEAREFLEYCNHPGGTRLSDLRRSHGYDKPHDVKFWCLGNEMDGPWQICRKTAEEYGRAAHETAKLMRWVDPSVILAACGSSYRGMPSYAAWEYEVLEHTFDHVDMISLHTYFTNPTDRIEDFFGVIELMDSFIKEVVAIADAVAAKRRSPKRIMLSFDEWNVWYRARGPEYSRPHGWPEAPKLIEEVYNFEDALIAGGALITLMNNGDRVKAACLAQLVNAIGAIMTETGGPAWRQTIFHPFAQCARHGHGKVMRTNIDCKTFKNGNDQELSSLLTTVVDDRGTGTTTIFALNRGKEEMKLEVELRGLGKDRKIVAAEELHHRDQKAINSKEKPEEVKPQKHPAVTVSGESVTATLKPLSWNVIVTKG
jgi:alpha-N-arabinofuranosidase